MINMCTRFLKSQLITQCKINELKQETRLFDCLKCFNKITAEAVLN